MNTKRAFDQNYLSQRSGRCCRCGLGLVGVDKVVVVVGAGAAVLQLGDATPVRMVRLRGRTGVAGPGGERWIRISHSLGRDVC